MDTVLPGSREIQPVFAPSGLIQGFSLLGKKAFVTGASRGIGRACALTLAAAGADVAVGSSAGGVDSAESVCREIRELGRHARSYSFDVSARGDVERACDQVQRDFEGIDVLVNNAGITRDRSFKKMDRDAWDEVLDT
ncbi:MAG TPA: SDR family NAD(P)-dependent oxidoreductase, partial [Polyangiaceae bacterium]